MVGRFFDVDIQLISAWPHMDECCIMAVPTLENTASCLRLSCGGSKDLSQRDKSNISNMSNIIFDFRAGAVGLKRSQNRYRTRLH
jgi:hypothetical protein